jgi:hypothetical protein
MTSLPAPGARSQRRDLFVPAPARSVLLLPPPPDIIDAFLSRLESGRIPEVDWLKDSGIS